MIYQERINFKQGFIVFDKRTNDILGAEGMKMKKICPLLKKPCIENECMFWVCVSQSTGTYRFGCVMTMNEQ